MSDDEYIELMREIARLRRRLEMFDDQGRLLPESADGIACRDETIRLQDDRINRLRASNAALLSLAHQYAGECLECKGTGLVALYDYDGQGSDADDQPCPECADIRAAIESAEGK